MFVDRQERTQKFESLEDLLNHADDAWIKAEIAKREAEIAAAEAAKAPEEHQVEGERKPN